MTNNELADKLEKMHWEAGAFPISCEELEVCIKALRTVGELQQVFDMQWEAAQRAIKRWQAAHPGNDMVWPDGADLLVWLMERLEDAV